MAKWWLIFKLCMELLIFGIAIHEVCRHVPPLRSRIQARFGIWPKAAPESEQTKAPESDETARRAPAELRKWPGWGASEMQKFLDGLKAEAAERKRAAQKILDLKRLKEVERKVRLKEEWHVWNRG